MNGLKEEFGGGERRDVSLSYDTISSDLALLTPGHCEETETREETDNVSSAAQEEQVLKPFLAV